jgi:hypothetical protein
VEFIPYQILGAPRLYIPNRNRDCKTTKWSNKNSPPNWRAIFIETLRAHAFLNSHVSNLMAVEFKCTNCLHTILITLAGQTSVTFLACSSVEDEGEK